MPRLGARNPQGSAPFIAVGKHRSLYQQRHIPARAPAQAEHPSLADPAVVPACEGRPARPGRQRIPMLRRAARKVPSIYVHAARPPTRQGGRGQAPPQHPIFAAQPPAMGSFLSRQLDPLARKAGQQTGQPAQCRHCRPLTPL